MKVFYHHNNCVTAAPTAHYIGLPLPIALVKAGKEWPDAILVWCSEFYRDYLNLEAIPAFFHHNKMMIAYQPKNNYMHPGIGYVEESTFLKVNKQVTFATWLMSPMVGAAHAQIFAAVPKNYIQPDAGYFLCSIAKMALPLGVFCYSVPALLKQDAPVSAVSNLKVLFRFVSQHYKKRWLVLLFINCVLHDKSLPLFSFFSALFFKSRKLNKSAIQKLSKKSTNILPPPEIDVVVPTIGRKKYVADFLQDLANQTLLPRQVIIVEQNPHPDSVTELDDLGESWPFTITHIFTHATGACQARNKALAVVKASWVFLADDDIRIKSNFLEQAYQRAIVNGSEVYNFSCTQPGQKSALTEEHQTFIFGAGCSMLTRRSLGSTIFNLSYEFGFSEDLEFAKQLVDKGYDTCFLPEPEVLHLKAPIGGFRTKLKHIWDEDLVQPKPAPTVLLFKMDHHTREQLLGYQTMLFFKFYFNQSIRNPLKYLSTFKARWRRSIYYANLLKVGKK